MQRSETHRPPKLALDLSRPVLLDAWAITLSVSIALVTALPAIAPALVCASALVCAAALAREGFVPERWRLMAVLAPLFVCAGAGIALLHASAPDPLKELAALEPKNVAIVGKVASVPVESGIGYRADLSVESLRYKDRPVLRGGGVELYAPGLDGVGVGDRIRVVGDVTLPPSGEGFDYAKYLSTKRISAVVEASGAEPVGEGRGWIGSVHRRTDVALGYGLHPEEAAVVRGIVLGDRSLIPDGLDEAYRRSGITHVLAISGQHVAVLAALVFFVLRAAAVPLAPRVLATLVLVWLYILVAGAPPSAIRAGVVATFVLGAGVIGRQLSPLHFMSTMLAFVLAWNPLLIYNAGFQLSVAAVFGILLFRKPLKQLLEKTFFGRFSKPPETVSNLLAVSLSAQVATAPIIAASFGNVSMIGVLTNLLAVPISGPILTLGLASALLGNVAPALAFPVNAVNGFLVFLLDLVAETTSSLPFASVRTPGVSPLMVAFFYVGCVPAALCRGGVFAPRRRTFWAAAILVWTALWLVLAGFSGL